MNQSRWKIRMASAFVMLTACNHFALGADLPIAPGPFKGDMDSLKQYKCPDWFRDVKFGIWSHWGPQAVPMAGDWYAKHMYVQGHPQYKHHLENYGHPSTNGYKEIIQLWKAEKWDPERLMSLYKKAGARYFVSMGTHHDNFFLWNSSVHKWNAVNMGPKRDVVGDWQKAAKKNGMKFGVSEHLGASFTWFQDSHKSDKTGPLAGVAYDGANPLFQDLYHFPAEPTDKSWYSNNPRWHQQWFASIKELVDKYDPDLVYTDGGVPFGNETGRSLIAHLYNLNTKGLKTDAIYTCKQKSEGRWIEDLERGVMAGINPDPWQTDTSIGDWYYNKNWKFRPVSWTIHMLVDIVSKNGNLLLNVVQRPDGSLDPEVEQALQELAEWMSVNSESIYETRPWLAYGEGAIKAKGGHFKEDFAYSSKDVRFATKGAKTLYATALGWPEDGQLTIRSVAKVPGVKGKISSVKLLGSNAKLEWTHDDKGLNVKLPAQKPCNYAFTLKIACNDVKAFDPATANPPAAAATVTADANGNYTLAPGTAEMNGNLKEESQGGQANIGFWDNPQDSASWNVSIKQAGTYKVTANGATTHPQTTFVVEADGKKVEGRLSQTGAWDKFAVVDLGTIQISKTGIVNVKIRPQSAAAWNAMNLRWVKLSLAK